MSSVARRYARALFALAKDGAELEQSAEQLGCVAAVAGDPSVAPVLRSPLLSAGRRRDLARMLARELGLSDLLTRFVQVVADHHRLGALPMINDQFQKMLDQALGRVRITVRSAGALDPTQEREILAAFSKLTGKDVIPRLRVEADLLGGVVVEVEGKVYDGSVRTQLDRLAKELSGAATL
jgi:F-type H+-transporting ATPase subunit delta